MTKTIPSALKLPSQEELQARFHYLKEEVEKIEGKAGPIRAKRDDLVNKNIEAIQALEKQVKEIEAPLFDMKMEMGQLVAILKGRTGLVGKDLEAAQAAAAAETATAH